MLLGDNGISSIALSKIMGSSPRMVRQLTRKEPSILKEFGILDIREKNTLWLNKKQILVVIIRSKIPDKRKIQIIEELFLTEKCNNCVKIKKFKELADSMQINKIVIIEEKNTLEEIEELETYSDAYMEFTKQIMETL